jgi:hypothetical protein
MDEIATLYSEPQYGGEMPFFMGKQYGSGWLQTLGKFAFPILKRFGLAAVNTARDVITKDQAMLPTLKEHAISAAGEILPRVANLFKGKAPKRSINNTRKTIFYKKHGLRKK